MEVSTKPKKWLPKKASLYFVQFTASWCQPCHWMDEVTYKDPQLIDYINENYIPVKVDIDDFDGFAYKQMYDIRMLPSVLVFSSEGNLLQKYEEALAPLKMLKILQAHDVPANRTIPRSFEQNEATRNTSSVSNHSPIKENISRPPLKPASSNDLMIESSPKKETAPLEDSYVDEDVYLDEMDEEVDGNESANHLIANPLNNDLQRFSVQVGVYSTTGNVEDKKGKLRKFFDEEFIVEPNQIDGKTTYKVMIGEFTDREKANAFRKEIESKGFKGVVKNLSSMR